MTGSKVKYNEIEAKVWTNNDKHHENIQREKERKL